MTNDLITDAALNRAFLYAKALDEIASASPSLHAHTSGEHRCLMCNVMIDRAREALGYKEWPAEARTKKEEKT